MLSDVMLMTANCQVCLRPLANIPDPIVRSQSQNYQVLPRKEQTLLCPKVERWASFVVHDLRSDLQLFYTKPKVAVQGRQMLELANRRLSPILDLFGLSSAGFREVLLSHAF